MKKAFYLAIGLWMSLTAIVTAAPKFSGSFPYQFAPGNTTINLSGDVIKNSSQTRSTGTILVQLWATAEPYEGGRLRGTVVASYTLDRLGIGRQYTDIDKTLKTTMPATRGQYYMCLVLSEYLEGGYVITDRRNYSNVITLGPFKTFTMSGPWTWDTDPDEGTITYTVKKISHTRKAKTGSLRIAAWATKRPYNGGAFTGYNLGSVDKKALETGYSYTDLTATTRFKRPPEGTYYITLFLMEFDGDEYVNMGWLKSNSTYTFD